MSPTVNENVNFIVTNANELDSVSSMLIRNIVILMNNELQLLNLYQEQVPSLHVVNKKFVTDAIENEDLVAAEEYLVK